MQNVDVITALAEAIANVDTNAFPGRLAELVERATGYESILFVNFSGEQGPRPLYTKMAPGDLETTLDPYLSHAYRLDPMYSLALNGAPDGLYTFSDWAPEGFKATEYYRDYYARIGLEDECAVFAPSSEGERAVLMFGTRSSAKVRREGLELIQQFYPCLRALCARHWGAASGPRDAGNTRIFEDLCESNGLSKREVQVVDLLLKGGSNKLIARDLNVSPETVKIYRKRINKKMGTSSIRELFAAFSGQAIARSVSGATPDLSSMLS
jgi:DNA-binding CsgD family transcriptional regulator